MRLSYVPALSHADAAPARAAVRARTAGTALLLTAALLPAAAAAQGFTRPAGDWVTLETPHFRFHAPRELEAWTRDVAARVESVRERVRLTVGHAPPRRVDVLVDDPFNQANGSAWPFHDGPAIVLWPVPPSPRSFIGNTRGWGELLMVHEFAHVAHLDRRSRNAWQRLWRGVVPAAVGPVATRTPRWAIEGYATYVEGALTGSGRPHAALRTAVLRQWALDGRLPSYGALNGSAAWQGGSLAYLMGSAYLEWLGARGGDSSLTALWRRMSARRNRGFDAAFAGVYGVAPGPLYARFAAQATVDAYVIRSRLDSAGLASGTLEQRLARGTGDPALSRDGRRMVIELAARNAPSRLVVWKAGADAASDTAPARAFARQQRRLLARDPEDVAAVLGAPLPRTPVATLRAVARRPHRHPRFLPDGTGILVTRDEPTPDGVIRPDLFVWTPAAGGLRRVTTGAAVQQGDPSPDGRQAAAVRCLAGRCDLVRVDLASGAVTTLVAGTLAEQWSRPRWAPDGSRLVAAVQRSGRWRVALVDPATGGVRVLSPDDGAERYDPTFTPDGRALVYVSERGGIPNVARLDLTADGAAAGDERPLTRVSGAALAPEPGSATGGGAVHFLDLTPDGYDLRRIVPDSEPVRGTVVDVTAPASRLARDTAAAVRAAVAQRPPVPVDTFAVGAVSAGRAYGAGPRRYVALPWGSGSPDGAQLGAQVASTDLAGRLTWLAQGALASQRAWDGVSLRATWRGLPVTVAGELFALGQDLAARARYAGGAVPPSLGADARWQGATIAAAVDRTIAAGALGGSSHHPVLGALDLAVGARMGVSAGRLRLTDRAGLPADGARPDVDAGRGLAFASTQVALGGGRGTRRTAVALSLHGSAGRTLDSTWQRGVASARLSAGGRTRSVWADALAARTSADAPAFERLAVGGAPVGLVEDATLSQRLLLPALPTGYRTGTRAEVVRTGLTVGGLMPYAGALRAHGTAEDAPSWTRLIGIEMRQATPFVPFARLPRSRVLAGVARVLDGPLADRTRGYVSVTFAP